ncbi:MAG TPA: NAD(P)-dependent oxidoreductase [Tepidisphaeraceae bacterium]|nr:NAD(P)-dependent oxidoreductase [Tepidisphaeraceae bacterium]
MGKPLKIAVCGGSGRVGQGVVKELVRRGHQVLNLDRRPAESESAQFVQVDLADRARIEPLFKGLDAVIQLAEIPPVHVGLAAEDVYAHNTRVSTVILQTAADVRVPRLIYTSTCQVYGCWGEDAVPPRYLPLDEAHPVCPRNVGALGKVANEDYAQWVCEHSQLSVAVFRLPWVMNFEPTETWWRELESQVGGLEGLGTYVHQRDVECAYALAVEKPRAGYEVYQLCADEIASVMPLRDRLKQMPGYPALPDDWPGNRSPVLTDKARAHFGWRPAYNVMDAYRQWRLGGIASVDESEPRMCIRGLRGSGQQARGRWGIFSGRGGIDAAERGFRKQLPRPCVSTDGRSNPGRDCAANPA